MEHSPTPWENGDPDLNATEYWMGLTTAEKLELMTGARNSISRQYASLCNTRDMLVEALDVCRGELRYANANRTADASQAPNTTEAIAISLADAALALAKGEK